MSPRRLLPRSLAGRIGAAAVLVVGLAMLVVGLGVVLGVSRADSRALDHDLAREADRIARFAERRQGPPQFGDPGAGRDGGVAAFPRPAGGPPPGALDPGADRFARVLRDGVPIVSSGASVPDGFPAPAHDGLSTVSAGGERWRVTARELPGGERLQVAARLAPLDARADRLRLVLALALGGALLATALAAGSLVRVALRPLDRLRRTAGEVAVTADLGRRVPVGEGPEEIDALAEDFNAMLARLQTSAGAREQALESARRFAADAGHELRTPLTSLRANLDAAGHAAAGLGPDAQAALAACAGDATRLQALVEQLQALARGEAGPPASAEPIDLGELADAAVLALRARHPSVRAELRAPASGPLVRGEAESLRMLLDNLLENAAVHGRADGAVTVTVAESGELLVDDDGDGIPVAERAAVLERFARGAGARGPGTGLGLSIAAAQAARHGGDLELGEAPAGGLRVCVRLPLAAA